MAKKRDEGHEETELVLADIEKEISKEYAQAEKEISEKLDDYLRRFEIKDKIKKQAVEDGKITEEEYLKWRLGQIAVGERWQEMEDTLAEDLTNAAEIGKSITDGHMPEVYAINHNYGTFQVEKATHVDTSYTLYDRQAVEHLFKGKGKLYHDYGIKTGQAIAEGKQKAWDRKQIQSVMTQALLQGESIGKIATRLANTVGDSDRKACIRNARTMATGVQNMGRLDSYKRAENMGIGLLKEWLATFDNRTRHEHRLLDGQRVPIDEKFKVDGYELECPADPEGEAFLVYNCRCTMTPVLKGFERDQSFRTNATIDGMTYEEWKESHNITSDPITKQDDIEQTMKRVYNNEYKELAGQTKKNAYSKTSTSSTEKTSTEKVSSEKTEDAVNTSLVKRGQIDTGYKGKIPDEDIPEYNKKAFEQIKKDTGYSDEEATKFHNALLQYFGGDYDTIETSPDSEVTQTILKGLDKMPKYDGSISRGLKFYDNPSGFDEFVNLKAGDTVPKKGVIESWSSDNVVAESYSKINNNEYDSVILICDDNNKGVGAQHISKYGKREAEVTVGNPDYEVEEIVVENKYDYLKKHPELETAEFGYEGYYDDYEDELKERKICIIKVKEK